MYFSLVIILLIADFLLDLICDISTLKCLDKPMPEEFSDVFDEQKYTKSQQYTKSQTRFGICKSSITLLFYLGFLSLDGFSHLDNFVKSVGFGSVASGSVFIGIVIVILSIFSLPFDIYFTFVLEAKFGFNKTSAGTFVLDKIKGVAISLILVCFIFSLIVYIFNVFGNMAWIYTWIAIIVLGLFLSFVAPVVILPLFNKFVPLADGELKEAISDYMQKQKFKISGLFSIDGSKRSTKANAFFTGFGKTKRIALYDTLIEKMKTPEIVAVLAHEVGHCVKGHVKKGLITGFLTTGFMLFLFSFFVNNANLYADFGVNANSTYIGMILFSLIFTPVSTIIDVFSAHFSRKHEYEADEFSAKTTDGGESLISALKVLSSSNLSNLTPSPLRVFISYSHPPVLDRIKALKEIGKSLKAT